MKRKKCVIKGQATEDEKSRLIQIISWHSNIYGDKLLDFMDQYNLYNLQSATVEQLREYCARYYSENTHNQER